MGIPRLVLCAVLVLHSFIHAGLVFLLGTGMKTQSGQSGDLVTMQATTEGGNQGSLNCFMEWEPLLAIVNATLGSA